MMRYAIATLLLLGALFWQGAPATGQTIPPPPPRILFVGNSLTYGRIHSEWIGGWGMAASAPDKDYVHRVQLIVAARTGQIPEIAVASTDIKEATHWDEAQRVGQAFAADIVILQMGDQAWALPEAEYKTRLRMVAGWYNPKRLIVVGGWYQDHVEQWNADVAAALGATFVPIHDLYQAQNLQYATCPMDSGAVCNHPGDAGMRLIAERIAAALLGPPTALYLPQLGNP
jgi:hypothetical protein